VHGVDGFEILVQNDTLFGRGCSKNKGCGPNILLNWAFATLRCKYVISGRLS
jgi:hypothetical protein